MEHFYLMTIQKSGILHDLIYAFSGDLLCFSLNDSHLLVREPGLLSQTFSYRWIIIEVPEINTNVSSFDTFFFNHKLFAKAGKNSTVSNANKKLS